MGREILFNEFMHLVDRIRKEDPDILIECAEALASELDGKGRNRKTKQWMTVEAKMETLYQTNWQWTPGRMASTVRRYLKIPFTMMPKLIKTAQQVKHRMYMRKVRAGDEEGNLARWDPDWRATNGEDKE